MQKNAYGVAMENIKKMFYDHYKHYSDCLEHNNTEGINFHSGAMLAISNLCIELFGDDELYGKYCKLFMLFNG